MKAPRMVVSLLVVIGLVSSSALAKNIPATGFRLAQEDLDSELEQELELDSAEPSAEVPAPADEFEEFEEAELPPPAELPPEDAPLEQAAPEIPATPEAEPEPEVAAPAPAPAGPPVTITGLDFKANENGGTVVIQTSSPTTYTTRSTPENNQFIIEVQNAVLPKKFQRPYNTKDFSGPIGSINAYQNPGGDVARIVLQMKQPIEPAVQQEGSSILVMAVGGAASQVVQESETASEPTPETPIEPTSEADAVISQTQAQEQILQSRTLDDFLSGNMKFYGRPISIQVKDGDIRDVFNFIAEESGLNLVLSEDVTGKVSLKLKEIPWDQALVVLMQSKQLGYVRQGNIVRIAQLKQIRAETDATKEVIEAQKQLQPLKVKVFPISYAQAKELEPQVQGFLTSRGKVRADVRTNSLVVSDISEVLGKVTKLLVALDTQTPQVLIEGKVVEARDTFDQQIGVEWDWSPGTPKTAVGTSVNSGLERMASLNLGNAQSGSLTIGPLVGRLFNWDTVSASLNLWEKEQKIKVLSSPRVVTLNNVKAIIEQIEEKPLSSISTVNGQTTVSVSYKQAKLQLQVTPQITAEGGVIMNLIVAREFFGAAQTLGSGDNTTQASPLNSRQAQTTVLVANGETAVVGGIYQADNSETEEGVPFLRKIPLLGKLFSSSTVANSKNELLIFLSPRVLNKEKAFGSLGQPSADDEVTVD